ncbi:MAG: hypothetical protein ACE5G2_07555 [Candidatus Krumholzibacteriia bacterium]
MRRVQRIALSLLLLVIAVGCGGASRRLIGSRGPVSPEPGPDQGWATKFLDQTHLAIGKKTVVGEAFAGGGRYRLHRDTSVETLDCHSSLQDSVVHRVRLSARG